MTSTVKIPEGWIETTLGQLVKVGRGSSPRPIQDYVQNFPGIPWVKIADATSSNSRFITETGEFIKEEGRSTTVYPGDLIVSNSATPGIPKFMQIEACVHDGRLVFSDYKNIEKDYLYYFFLNYRRILEHQATGTVFKNLKTDIVRNLEIIIPENPQEQKAIAGVLSAFDDKIELLRAENQTLEEMGQTLFKERFGKYKVGDELPDGWKVGKLGDVVDNYDSKRIPIASDKREIGEYPYYGATGINGYIKDYIFDGIYTLLGEDGSVMKENGKPFTQYVWGKIRVNNHAHVLQGKNGFSTEMIKIILDSVDITPYVTGAVQLKISQGNMNSIPIIIPTDDVLVKFNSLINPIFAKIRANSEEIESLSKTRDQLLPKLMSGEVRVEF